jgi:cholesterol transport system auxiliary component
MSHRYWRASWVAGVLAISCLGGCISLLPKVRPAQMYRFGAGPTPLAAPAAGQTRLAIRAAPTTFERAAAGDRILTVSGNQTAYIAGARWVTAANNLFDDAVFREFVARGGRARLLARDEPAPADYVLKLDVQAFEARYDHGRGAPPTVVVRLYAALVGYKNDPAGASQVFQAEAPAGTDSVHAITAAFDTAVGKVLGDMVGWVETKAQGDAKPGVQANAAG